MKLTTKFKAVMADGLQNVLSGLGVKGIDKNMSAHYVDISLSWHELESAYSADWLAGKICDVPPFDMTREWRSFGGNLDPQKILEFQNAERAYKVRGKIREALTLSRIYGGAGIVMNVDDGLDPWEPLNIEAIKKDGLRWLLVSDAQYLKPAVFDLDPFSENYGFPEFYRMAPSSIQIHHTRVIRFDGVPLPLAARRRNQYWGKSVIERLYTALQNASQIQSNIGALVYEASVDVIKVPDLIDRVSSKEGEAALTKRFSLAKLQKSINRMLLLDTEEEYETHQQTFAGLKDMMQSYLNIVAGAADIPITRLLGQSPGGLTSTGESDMRNYYDFIAGQQESVLRSKLERIDDVMYRSTFGTAPDDDVVPFEFNSLWQMSDVEKSTRELANAQRDQIYLDRGVITDGIVAKELMADGTYLGIDPDYIDELEINEEDDEDELDIVPSNDANSENPGEVDDISS